MRSHIAILRKLTEGNLDPKKAYVAGKNGKLVLKDAKKVAVSKDVVLQDVEERVEVTEVLHPTKTAFEEAKKIDDAEQAVEFSVFTEDGNVETPTTDEEDKPKKKLQNALKKKKFTE